MEFKDKDGDELKVSAGNRAVLVEAWSGEEYVFLAFDPVTAKQIALALLETARKVKRGEGNG